ncbi:LacI family DNA-binding transcriptional regulator [Roseicitreum antarcticum]|uniref:LacI family transcriptional regulator n=1 Tax=Roseicitreum antarcticum TaxID=564137 RepID=A0A1H3BWA1_9RHOB|nr:LacI family DNA-binding transcriptional regulator [Roseicitreum antarcticum]SDX46272.1 LacI family transcriptional regulator [Roseicitreum antarcticum]
MRKPTLQDVARVAGVSYATADRVLNARGGVAQKSASRVQEAIETLGYERDLHAANLSRRRVYQFRFLLPKADHSFFHALRAAVDEQQAARRVDRILITVTEVPALDPEALAEALESPDLSCDCLAVVATEAPRITKAIAALRERGIAVVTLVGDAAPEARAAYVGINNVVAGATSGRLMRLAHFVRPGCILPVLGALSARDHRERLEGAHAVLTEGGAGLRVLPALCVHDRPDLMRTGVIRALMETPEITGIYSIGAGNRGLIEVVGAMTGPRPFIVAHELTPTTRAGLEQGLIDAVIDQKPAQEVATAIDVMKALADGRDWQDPARDIIPTIFLADNLPQCGSKGETS